MTFIKSVLSNLPIYYMFIFKCPILAVNPIEKLQQDFLGHGRSEEQKLHLVDWASVCNSKQEGGLGYLRQMNQALRGKWLWRLGDESEGLWRQLVMAKYGRVKDSWDVQDDNYKSSAIWKHITSVKENLMKNIKYQVS